MFLSYKYILVVILLFCKGKYVFFLFFFIKICIFRLFYEH
nr:MAG TPA: hypothetical protein [Caudoviricetes sp.]